MAVVITWTHEWSSSDDGTVLSGADLQNVQTDIESHSHTSGIETFLALSDTPDSYTSQANKILAVNSGATAVEFTDTIGGTKTFSNIPVLPSSDPTSDNQAARKAYVDGKFGIYDSGWVAVPSSGADSTLTHNLGTIKVIAQIWGATGSSGENAAEIANESNGYFLGLTQLTTTTIKVSNRGISAPGHIWNGSSWVHPTHVRVLLFALE